MLNIALECEFSVKVNLLNCLWDYSYFLKIPESLWTIKSDMSLLLKCPWLRHRRQQPHPRLQRFLRPLHIVHRLNVLQWVKSLELRWIRSKMVSIKSWCIWEFTSHRRPHCPVSSIFSPMFRYVSNSKIHHELLKPSLIRSIATTRSDSLGDIR